MIASRRARSRSAAARARVWAQHGKHREIDEPEGREDLVPSMNRSQELPAGRAGVAPRVEVNPSRPTAA